MDACRFRVGFETQTGETAGQALPWIGTPPAWLSGDLLRTGPAKFEAGAEPYRHWFDGLAMLHRFALSPRDVRYTNRFLRSDAYAAATDQHRARRSEFATNSDASYLNRVRSAFAGHTTDNANVNLADYGDDEFVALTEVPKPIRFDRQTLATQQAFAWQDDLKSHVTTAHPHYDFRRRLIYNCDILFHQPSLYRFTRMAFGSAERQVVADIPVQQPAYMHSFGMSENHLVLVEFPFITNPIRLLLSGRPFIETYRWRPERGLSFTVVAKDTGAIVKNAATDACFGFHIINSFERDDAVVIDLIAYEDAAIVNSFYLDRLRAGGGPATGTLTRFTIPLGQGSVEREILADATLELPAFDYRGLAGHPYRYLWSAGQVADGFMNRLQKFDLCAGTARFWSQPGCYPGEPIFVPVPNAEAQDQGVILSIVLDAAQQRSFLLVLDAATLSEQARAWTSHVIPFGFHGTHRAARGDAEPTAIAAE